MDEAKGSKGGKRHHGVIGGQRQQLARHVGVAAEALLGGIRLAAVQLRSPGKAARHNLDIRKNRIAGQDPYA